MAEHFNHLRDLQALSYIDAEPRILIGLRNLELFTPLETRIGQPGNPVVVSSTLGWAIYGRFEIDEIKSDFVGIYDYSCKTDEELNDQIRQQFVIEKAVVCVSPLPESVEDKHSRQILNGNE